MKILFSMFSELSVISQNIYKYKWMGLKVYLEFGRAMAKYFEQSITSSQDIMIINIGHKHFVGFCFKNKLPTQSFIWICLWKPQIVPQILGHWNWWLWHGTNEYKYFCVWWVLPITRRIWNKLYLTANHAHSVTHIHSYLVGLYSGVKICLSFSINTIFF